MAIALYLSFLMITFMSLYLVNIKNKKQLHWSVFWATLCAFLWALGNTLDRIFTDYLGYTYMFFAYVSYTGVIFSPIALWFTSLVLKHRKIELKARHLLSLIVPIISNIVLWTDNYTHLFYRKYCYLDGTGNEWGAYFYFVHTPYSYMLIVLWAINIYEYARKNKGLMAKQVVLVVIGTVASILTNILFTFKFIESAYWNVVAFAFTILCYLVAIKRYGFLNVVPLAKEKIIDDMTDCFIILGPGCEIQNFNKPFVQTFGKIFPIKLMDNFVYLLGKSNGLGITQEYFEESVNKSIRGEPQLPLEVHLVQNGVPKWYSIEINCVDHDKNVGTVITIEDITHIKRYERIETERMKLRELAEIAGDLSHDINTPLSLVRNLVGHVYDKLKEFEAEPNKIVGEFSWLLDKSKIALETCEKSLAIANKLRKQATCVYEEKRTEFKLRELILDAIKMEPEIELLLKREKCSYNISCDAELTLLGYPQNLLRVLRNVIKNAIESYRGCSVKNRVVEITVSKVYEGKEEEEMVSIKVVDYGQGIDESIKDDIFRVPLKIKNLKPDGGGIGLFFTSIIVIGQLEGKIWFESQKGKGTTFYICIPCICRDR